MHSCSLSSLTSSKSISFPSYKTEDHRRTEPLSLCIKAMKQFNTSPLVSRFGRILFKKTVENLTASSHFLLRFFWYLYFLSISARYLLLCTDKKRYINTFCLLFYSILAWFSIDINCCILIVTFCEKHFVNKVYFTLNL